MDNNNWKSFGVFLPPTAMILRGLDGLTTEWSITLAIIQHAVKSKCATVDNPVKNVFVIRDSVTGMSKGYAYVEMASLNTSVVFVEDLKNGWCPLEVDGKAILVDYCKNTFSTA